MDTDDRMKLFRDIQDDLIGKGYESRECTISVLKANVLSIVVMLPMLLACWFIYHSVNGRIAVKFGMTEFLISVILLIVFTFIHEILHGVTGAFFLENGFSEIHIGFMKKEMTPYCLCKKPMLGWQYLVYSLMPLLVVGFGVFAVACIWNLPVLYLVSLLNVLGAGGDVLMSFIVLRCKDMLVLDHPSKVGFMAFYNK